MFSGMYSLLYNFVGLMLGYLCIVLTFKHGLSFSISLLRANLFLGPSYIGQILLVVLRGGLRGRSLFSNGGLLADDDDWKGCGSY